jgi:hypothetical protein
MPSLSLCMLFFESQKNNICVRDLSVVSLGTYTVLTRLLKIQSLQKVASVCKGEILVIVRDK